MWSLARGTARRCRPVLALRVPGRALAQHTAPQTPQQQPQPPTQGLADDGVAAQGLEADAGGDLDVPLLSPNVRARLTKNPQGAQHRDSLHHAVLTAAWQAKIPVDASSPERLLQSLRDHHNALQEEMKRLESEVDSLESHIRHTVGDQADADLLDEGGEGEGAALLGRARKEPELEQLLSGTPIDETVQTHPIPVSQVRSHMDVTPPTTARAAKGKGAAQEDGPSEWTLLGWVTTQRPKALISYVWASFVVTGAVAFGISSLLSSSSSSPSPPAVQGLEERQLAAVLGAGSARGSGGGGGGHANQ